MRTVGDVLELAYGKALRAESRSGGSVPVVGSGGVVGAHSVGITKDQTIVVGRKGSIGSVTWIDGPAWPIDTAYYVKAKAPDLDLRWTYWMLGTLSLSSMNKSAAVPGLNREDVYRLPIAVPPPSEQRRIAAILDQADAIRTKRLQVLSHLDSLPVSLFAATFGDPARNPHGYSTVRLGDIAVKFSDGPFGSNLKSSHYTTSGVPVIRLQNIGVGRFSTANRSFVSEAHYASLAKHDCQPGDVLIGTLGDPNLRACIQPQELPVALNKADCIQFRVNRSLANPSWACWLLNMPGTLALASSLAHGQTRTRISMGKLRELSVPLPPVQAQDDFALKLHRVAALRKKVECAIATDEAQLASLQSHAFRGEL